MTDQTESASENAELLADLGFYDEDHWRNVMRQYPGAQDAIRKAAAAIRALEAKVHRLEAAVRDRNLAWQDACADRDRLAGEVERLRDQVARLTAEVAALRIHERRMAHLVSEDCHAGRCRVYLASDELPLRDMYDADILRTIDEDAARRAGEESQS